ncbi:LysR family transcriptional regulator [Agrobacterium rhizogenes]|uniref:LysR family transcriptional regulator n=1 Tax=Rhizobium rhizogenes TaxID=359 RepID=UPI0022B61E6E|nr:LysR family transcriptional regulator [Rhizobium rhizogenes]MCZ7451008.1 LysR family transcriptional regulator [Rhizobium rhizogenes]
MTRDTEPVPLNAIRAFAAVARECNLTRAAQNMGTTQSSISRHLAVLETYLGASLFERRGRAGRLTEFGRLYAGAISEPLETICFTTNRMKRRDPSAINRLVVRTSLSTFASHVLVPNLQLFSNDMGGVTIDVVSSLTPPDVADSYDVLITRDLHVEELADEWLIHREELVCVGAPAQLRDRMADIIRAVPILAITSRPDILPTWLKAMGLSGGDILAGARVDHHYLALPAVTTGKCLLVAPEIIVSPLVRNGFLTVIPDTRTPSGMDYRAFALDRSGNPELARAFCRWLIRLCKSVALAE